MIRLARFLPDAAIVLAMAPEELAGELLQAINVQRGTDGRFREPFGNFTSRENYTEYEGAADSVALAVSEAWSVLVLEGIFVLDPGAQYNTFTLSRRGKAIKTKTDFTKFRHASLFPKDAIHPEISRHVYSIFLSGDYETAVFKAYRTVEIAVREACGVGFEDEIGVPLMRNAFRPSTGPLTNAAEHSAEQESLMHLFAGATGRFKNPGSHRMVPMDNPRKRPVWTH